MRSGSQIGLTWSVVLLSARVGEEALVADLDEVEGVGR